MYAIAPIIFRIFDSKINMYIMIKKSTCLLMLFFFFTAFGYGAVFEKISNGVIIYVAGQQTADHVRMVRLQVMGEKVIHVSATPENKFSLEPSLIIVPQKCECRFSVFENKQTVVLSTDSVKAYVDKRTGEVDFTDNNGKSILCENKGGGKSFKSIEVEGTKGYELRQVFESPDDEAFFGLGQHQADEFDYKGKNEELFQYNTKVSVPFVLSNKNYGILWDNYSLSRFGDSRKYSQLNEVFKVYDKNGVEGGLTGTYTPAETSGKKTLVRTEPFLYFENGKSNEEYLPKDFPLMGSKISFEGALVAPKAGVYHFKLYYAGYVKVYLNNQLLFPERWRTAWNPNSYKFTHYFEPGQRVTLRVEWIPDGSISYCGLRVHSALSKKEQNKLSLFSEMGNEINYYFIKGSSPDDVISGYRKLTGKATIIPKWAMGFWQSRERYKTQDELVGTLREFRKRKIPIDNIIQDWYYWKENDWGSHEFDKSRYPDPQGMVDSIHALHGRLMISVWPKFYMNTEHFKEFDRRGWMYRQAIKDSIRDWVGKGHIGSFYDAYSSGARKLFWKQLQQTLFPLGIDSWWMDASEPNVKDCTDMDYRKKLCGPTALGPSTKYFNAYALMNAEAIYDGQRSTDPNRRVFLLTRSGFAGLQRYSTATWSGDIASRWEDMKAQISAGLNFCMSGIPYWTMDVGGFCVENRYVAGQQIYDKTGEVNSDYKEWRELNTRWYQFGAFCPLYRAHGQFPYREIWNIAPKDHPAYQSIAYYTKLRYHLMPYIYSLAGMTYFKDYTIMRALVMDFEGDTIVNHIGDQYMFGPALMVCPVYKYEARQREVYFPKSTGWYDFYTGKFIAGGQRQKIDAPYERIPLFVREGAIIPFEPRELQYTDEKPADDITLYVYGGHSGNFTLYEDEGVNYNYEKGKYSMIPFAYDDTSHRLRIGKRQGEYHGMLNKRKFHIIYIDKTNPQPFDLKNGEGKEVSYDGDEQIVKL